MNELVFAPASELAAAIARKGVSAVEVLEVHPAWIAEHNPRINQTSRQEPASPR